MSPASSGQSVEGAFSNVATPIISQSSPVFVHQMVFCDVNGCYSNFTSTSVGLFTNPSSLFFFCLCCFFTSVYTCPLFCINCSVQLNTLTIIWSPYTHTIYLFSVWNVCAVQGPFYVNCCARGPFSNSYHQRRLIHQSIITSLWPHQEYPAQCTVMHWCTWEQVHLVNI